MNEYVVKVIINLRSALAGMPRKSTSRKRLRLP